jgi:hypothetical protein
MPKPKSRSGAVRSVVHAFLAAAVVLLLVAIGFAQTTPADCAVSHCMYAALVQKSEPSPTPTVTPGGPPTPLVTTPRPTRTLTVPQAPSNQP